MTLTVLRNSTQVFCRMPLYWNLSLFLIIRQGSGGFRRKTTEVKCHFHYIIAFCQHDLSLLLLTLADVVFFRFLYSEVTLLPPPPILYIFGTKLLCAARTVGGHSYSSAPWGRSIYEIYLEFCTRGLSLLRLLTYSFISVWT